ncbi:MAG: hypothetical protein ABIO91_01885 [Pyrinomonadaceae bacterium]
MNNVQYVSGAINPGDCVSGAWSLVTRRFGLYIGVGLVTLILIACIPFVGSILFGPVIGGFYYLVLRDARDEPVDFGMMFKGFERFLPLMLAGVIQAAPSLILTVVQYTADIARLVGVSRGGDANFYQPSRDAVFAGISAGIMIVIVVLTLLAAVWSVALSFAVPLILEHDLGVVDALLTSAKAAFSNIGGLIVLVILEALVGILGVIALCIGIFVAIPVIYAANVLAYRMVFPYFERSNINMSPPPPEAYGNFGQGM